MLETACVHLLPKDPVQMLFHALKFHSVYKYSYADEADLSIPSYQSPYCKSVCQGKQLNTIRDVHSMC